MNLDEGVPKQGAAKKPRGPLEPAPARGGPRISAQAGEHGDASASETLKEIRSTLPCSFSGRSGEGRCTSRLLICCMCLPSGHAGYRPHGTGEPYVRLRGDSTRRRHAAKSAAGRRGACARGHAPSDAGSRAMKPSQLMMRCRKLSRKRKGNGRGPTRIGAVVHFQEGCHALLISGIASDRSLLGASARRHRGVLSRRHLILSTAAIARRHTHTEHHPAYADRGSSTSIRCA